MIDVAFLHANRGHASTDSSIFLVEKFCGRSVALECARSLVIDMPRACQAGFAVLPIGERHGTPALRIVRIDG
jgi:transcriptional regulator GlxA family with amidase domain